MRGFPERQHAKGQAMVEYVLIAALIALAIFAAVTLTGPAVGNIFSNVITNASGEGTPIYDTPNAATLDKYSTDIANFKNIEQSYKTNTPLVPTCVSGVNAQGTGTWAPTLDSPAPKGTWVNC